MTFETFVSVVALRSENFWTTNFMILSKTMAFIQNYLYLKPKINKTKKGKRKDQEKEKEVKKGKTGASIFKMVMRMNLYATWFSQ